jgi:serine/threonine-protein kinase
MAGDVPNSRPWREPVPPEPAPPTSPGGAGLAETHLPHETPPDLSRNNHPTVASQENPPDVPAPQGSLGPYQLLEETACGGMGVVYKARHARLGRVVALKTIRRELGTTPGAVRRFEREVRAAARLQHPHIVPIYEVSEAAGRPYFTMPFLGGGSLGQRRAQLIGNPQAAVALLEKVARAVHHAHEAGILHRDLKPSNILLDERGEPLVSDFGLAKLQDLTEELTQSGEMLGTPAYMAPEQAAGRNECVGRTADVWALGVLLFELTTGRRPFAGEGREALLRQIQTADPPSPRALCPQLDRGLETVILKCLEKEPARRYATAADLADDLARWSRGESPQARPQRWPGRLARAASRHPGWWAAVAACLAVLAALALARHFGDPEPPQPQHSGGPERPLQTAEARLARGEKVVLVGEAGGPAWSRVATEAEPTRVSVQPGQPLSLGTLGVGVVELLAEPQGAYRFRAQVRHDEDTGLGEAGLVLCYHKQATPLGVEHCCCQLSFSDSGPASRRYQAEGEKLPPRYSAVSLTLRRYRDRGPSSTVPLGVQRFFLPAALTPGGQPPWHDLAVTVRPDRLEAFWDGQSLGQVSWQKLHAEAPKLKWGGPGVTDDNPNFHPAPAPHQGLGLYLQRGAASFRRVIVEPLR